jgi:hypothetical protein
MCGFFALIFSIGYRYMTLAPALTVVALMAHRLVILHVPEATAEAHAGDVVHDVSDAPTLHAQRVGGQERAPVLTPRGSVVPWLLVPALMHLLTAWRGVWHAWHYTRPLSMACSMMIMMNQ